MSKEKLKAIVIKAVKYGEHDKMLTLFCATKGKISAVAKGAASPKSKYIASCQMFTASEFILNSSDKDKIPYIETAEVLNGFFPISADYTKMIAACYMCELVNIVFEDSTQEELAFSLLYFSLKYLSDSPTEKSYLFALCFSLKLLGISGSALSLKQCLVCECENDKYFLNYDSGGIVCANCENDYLDYPLLTQTEAKYMDMLMYCDMEAVKNSLVPQRETLIKLLTDVNNYYRYLYSKNIKSFDIFIS